MLSGISYYIGPYLNETSAVQFYYSFVFSTISYGIVTWGGNLNKTNKFDTLFRKHKKIVKNLFAKFGLFDYNEICANYALLKLKDIYNYFLAVLVYKVKRFGSDLSLSDRLSVINSHRHNYNTRGCCDLYLPFPRLNLIKFGYIYNSLKLWNALEDYIKSSNSVSFFKGKVKQKYIDSYKSD